MSRKRKSDKTEFSFEDLKVWQKSVDFADKVIEILDNLNTDRKHYRLIEQLESFVTFVSMNIAEGKGRYSKREYIHFLYIARGSLYETVSLLMILRRRNWIDEYQLNELKSCGNEIGKMLYGLIHSIKNSMSYEQRAKS